MTTDPSEPLECDGLASLARDLFATERTGSGLFGPPEPTEPPTDPAAPTGAPISPREGANPTPAPSQDHDLRAFARDLFNNN